MSANPVLWNLDARGVATVTLNRPEVNNAYDAGLINGVLAAMDELGQKPNLRVVVLKGNGKHFQAGADLKWINGVRPKSAEENEKVSRATFEAVQRLNTLPIPTVALVQGGCFGGGTGVISACDVVVAADNALFSITEVRWGLTAAIIIPQLCDAIGVRQVRRYALTGERFGADDARRIGLVHEVVPLAELETAGAKVVEQLLTNGPEALAETKALAMESSFGGMGVDDDAYARLVRMHSDRRQTKEASEGLASFAEKRAIVRDEGNAVTGDGAFHQHVALVRTQQRTHLNGDAATRSVEDPFGPGGEKAQAAMIDQIAWMPRNAMRFEIARRRAQQALEPAQRFIDDATE
jgi:methylglutaconyl-CoA hydratase